MVNLRTLEAKTYLDGVLDNTATFASVRTVFDEVTNGFRVGQRVDGTLQFEGQMAAWYLYRRELTAGEVYRMWKLGREGVLR
jgi:hypothetical protein